MLHETLVFFLQRWDRRTVELQCRISFEGAVGVCRVISLGHAMLRDTYQKIFVAFIIISTVFSVFERYQFGDIHGVTSRAARVIAPLSVTVYRTN